MKRMQHKSRWATALLSMAMLWQNAASQQHNNSAEVRLEFPVRYLTLEAVYFNGGTINGIRSGDQAWVMRNGARVLQLQVSYVSEHSASCLLKTAAEQPVEFAVRMDDRILVIIPSAEAQQRAKAVAPAPEEPRERPGVPQARVPKSTPKSYRSVRRTDNLLSGQISLQSFGQHDQSAQRYDFFQPSAYLRLNFERPGGLPLRFTLRVRSSQNYRQIGTSSLVAQPALHRVYEIGLEYTTPAQPLELTLGRMLRYDLRGVGYLDGLALGYRLNAALKAGAFYGTQPNLYDYAFSLDEKKLGVFAQLKAGLGKSGELQMGATGVGQYLRGQVSREYLALQADLNWVRQWYLTNYFELDLNRGWRKPSNGRSLDLSNAYFNAVYYPRSALSLGLSYDARRLLRTFETQALADSLFDRALRQGWRVNVSLQPTALTRFTLDGGLQTHASMPAVYSAGASATLSNLARSNIAVNARLSYFGNALSAGYYPSLDLARSFWGRVYATVGGGAYVYRMDNASAQVNPWERVRLDLNLMRRFFFSGTLENFHGDTMNFVRGFVDLGWRF